MTTKTKWNVVFNGSVEKVLDKLPKSEKIRISKFISQKLICSSSPRSHGKALQGHLKGLWRYRVGSYRILCKIIDKEVTILVIDIGHRKDIYE